MDIVIDTQRFISHSEFIRNSSLKPYWRCHMARGFELYLPEVYQGFTRV